MVRTIEYTLLWLSGRHLVSHAVLLSFTYGLIPPNIVAAVASMFCRKIGEYRSIISILLVQMSEAATISFHLLIIPA
jgi:hypothetical protein